MKTTSRDLFIMYQARARAIGWSVAELCRRAGVSRATLSLWRLGGTSPNLGTVQKLDGVLTVMEGAVARLDLEDAQRGGP